jgi:hypothetical protein
MVKLIRRETSFLQKMPTTVNFIYEKINILQKEITSNSEFYLRKNKWFFKKITSTYEFLFEKKDLLFGPKRNFK